LKARQIISDFGHQLRVEGARDRCGVAAVAVGVVFPCGQSAPNRILLNPIESPPKISAVIIAAAGLQQLRRGNGRIDFAFGISEVNYVSGFCEGSLLCVG
jgi:hypothetical protein